MEAEDRIRYAVEHTEVIRPPKQTLATFGIANIYYYLLTEPVYTELMGTGEETVVREGRLIAERPKIVTPYYLSRTEGFSSEAVRYFEALIKEHALAENKTNELEANHRKLPQFKNEWQQAQAELSRLTGEEEKLHQKRQNSQELRSQVNYFG